MSAHEELFAKYVEELREARVLAETWWKGLLNSAEGSAAAKIRRRWSLGPASHPLVLAVLRKYYLECEALNQEVPDDEESPMLFVTEWLLDEDTEELAEFIADLTFWPIGVADDGSPI